MTQAKADGNNQQPFDVELFERKYFEFLENDPTHWANEFEFCEWKYADPGNLRGKAYVEMLLAKQKIRELLAEISKQEAIVRDSQRIIRKHNRLIRNEKPTRRGRPERSSDREEIVKKFIMKWVASLKDALEVKSCGAKGGLENMVSLSAERNWRRWLNGDAIPSFAKFENLLESKITGGKYAGKSLRNVPVNPTHNQILRLLQFI